MEVAIFAVTRFAKVAKLIAFARIVVENTSEGISHAPGPIPKRRRKDKLQAQLHLEKYQFPLHM